jgi:hypothetical protein
VNCQLVPGVLPPGVRVTFQEVPGVTCSGKFKVTVQPLKAVVPVLVTLTSTWKKLPCVLDGVAVQLCAAYAFPFNNRNRPSARLDNRTMDLRNIFIPTLYQFNY